MPVRLKEIFEALTLVGAPNNSASPHFFIFMYGTDCFFNKKVGANLYHLELDIFSYMALVTSQALNEHELHDDSGLAYLTESVAVLNGPDNFGFTCQALIAKAVLLALRAVAYGKPNLYIAGHSRGAVQAALVIQELDRIRVQLNTSLEPALSDVLCQSSSERFNAAMRALLTSGLDNSQFDTQENREGLLQQINAMTYSPFLMEPVPGNAPDLPVLNLGTWNDTRFDQPMPTLKKHCFLYAGDERARGFRPIVFLEKHFDSIKEMPFDIIHGHHGTLFGNCFHRFGEDAQSEDKEARDSRFNVIKWVLFQLMYFINKDTNIFSNLSLGVVNCTEFNTLLSAFCNPEIDNRMMAIDRCIDAMIAAEHTRDFKDIGYGLGAEEQWDQRLTFSSQRPAKSLERLPHYTLEDRLSALVANESLKKRKPIDHMLTLEKFLRSEPKMFSRVAEALFYQYRYAVLSASDENKFWDMINRLFKQEDSQPFYEILEKVVNARCQNIRKELVLVRQSLPQVNSQGFWLNLLPREDVSVETLLKTVCGLYQKASRIHQGIVDLECGELREQLEDIKSELLNWVRQCIQNKFDEIAVHDKKTMIVEYRQQEVGRTKELKKLKTVLFKLKIEKEDSCCPWQSLMKEYIVKVDARIEDKKGIIEQLELTIQKISVNHDVIVKLQTLTDKYHSHLQKTNNNPTNCDDKIAIIEELQEYLLSGQFVEFFDKIRDEKTIAILSKRRDSAFIIFWEAVLDVLMMILVVATGFLPLEIYKAMGGHFRFFSTAKGESFVDEGIQLAQNLALDF